MIGRNGNDALNNFLIILSAVFLLLSILFRSTSRLFAILVDVLIAISLFRALSRNYAQRQKENGKYLSLRYRLFTTLKNLKERWVQRKEYKFFTCPTCKAMLRVPRGRGKIKIVCRKCGTSFIGKS